MPGLTFFWPEVGEPVLAPDMTDRINTLSPKPRTTTENEKRSSNHLTLCDLNFPVYSKVMRRGINLTNKDSASGTYLSVGGIV